MSRRLGTHGLEPVSKRCRQQVRDGHKSVFQLPNAVLNLVLIISVLLSVVATASCDEMPLDEIDRDHWSFRPLQTPDIPKTPGRFQNPIDAFIAEKLHENEIRALPDAGRATLLRRLKFDLLGLPPTVSEIASFTAPNSTTSYEQLVDRYLASPRFGERWAQHWLDLARFAETDGFEHDKVRSHAWRYRDWVVRALNSDMPYDRFVQLQLAGDELQPNDPDAATATAFCLSGPDMPDINSQDERRHNLLNEMTATIGSVILGLQLGCAQCHDHKYDPISQADFYRMRAIFDPGVQIQKNKSVFTLANTKQAQATFVMLRGDYRRPGDPIAPGFLRIADLWNSSLPPAAVEQSRGRRTALAEWLTRPDHPLTSRVIVNRIWQQHFGQGLCRSASDFGVMGETPTHERLLDWLACYLVDHDWSLKSLHRLIVTSATYRRASRATDPAWSTEKQNEYRACLAESQSSDPNNELLARFSRRRLEGEIIRDAMFAVSDSLDLRVGGPGVRPPLPPEMVKTLLHRQWEVTKDTTQHRRRSIYVFARRNLRFPIFDAFDRPAANVSCDCRNESTTATQSLLLLNSNDSLQLANRLAEICKSTNDVTAAVNQAFLRCFGRPMSADERDMIALPLQRGEMKLGEVCLSLFNANEFIYID